MGIKGTVTLADKNEIRPEIKSIKMKVTSKILSTLLFQSGEHNLKKQLNREPIVFNFIGHLIGF